MVKFEIDTSDLQRVIMRMPAAIKTEVGDGLDHASRKFLKEFAARILSAPVWYKSSALQGTVKNTRGFFKGFKRLFTFASEQGGMGVMIFTQSKLAKIQEEGANLTSSGGIPVPLSARANDVMTTKGRVKKSLWNLKTSKNIKPIKFKGQVYLTEVFKKTREVKPLFVIKPSVDLGPRLEFHRTFNDMQPALYKIIAKSIIKGIEKAWNG